MSKGTRALVAWLGLATLLLIAIFSAIVLLTGLSPKNNAGHHVSVVRQLYLTLLHTIDSGTIGGDVGGWTFLVLMLLVTIGGIFIVSALIGVIATGLDAKLEDLRKGRSFVVETGHTLILDWSDSIFTILSELAIANESERRPVAVVLADRDKVEMEDAIRQPAATSARRGSCAARAARSTSATWRWSTRRARGRSSCSPARQTTPTPR